MTIYATTVTQADGTTNVFAVPFPYIDKSHVFVTVNGVAVDPNTLTFLTTGTVQLPMSAATLAQAVVQIQRRTPSLLPYVVFEVGGLDPGDLNSEVLQLLYFAQELYDQALSTDIQQYVPPVIGNLQVLLSQVFQGLADPNNIGYDPNNLVMGNLPADIPYNPVSAGLKGYVMRLRDAVYNFISIRLGLPPGGMTLFMQQCAMYPTTPDDIAVPTMGTVVATAPLTVALMSQIYQGLGDPTNVGYDPNNLVLGDIPPQWPYSAVNVGFRSSTVRIGDAVYNFIRTRLSLSEAQMSAFYNQCLSYQVTPLP